MKTFLKYSAYALLAIFVVGAASVWWKLHDTEGMKRDAKQTVRLLTGRELQINGALDIDIESPLSRATITIWDFSLSNAEWAEADFLLSGDRLMLTLDPSSIFADLVVVNNVEIDGAVVNLESNEDGKWNWDIAPPTVKSTSESSSPFRIERIALKQFDLAVDSPQRSTPMHLGLDQFILDTHENGSAEVNLNGALNDLPISLKGSASPLRALLEGGAFSHDLQATMGPIELNTEGRFEDIKNGTGANISFRFSGPEIASLFEYLALPEVSRGEFEFSLNVETRDNATRIDLEGDLGNLGISAKGTVDRLMDPDVGQLAITANGANLKALGQVMGLEGLPAKPYQLSVDVAADSGEITLHSLEFKSESTRLGIQGSLGNWPDMLGLDIKLGASGEDLSVWGPLAGLESLSVKPFVLAGTMRRDDAGRLTATADFSAGQNRLSVGGYLGELPGFMGADLTFDASTPDLRSIALLGRHASIPNVVVELSGSVGLSEEGLKLEGIELQVGQDRLELRGLLVLQDHFSGSELYGLLDVANIAATGALFNIPDLPSEPLHLSVDVRPKGRGLEFHLADGNMGEISMDLSGTVPDMKTLAGIEADFDIALPSLHLIPGTGDLPDRPLIAKGRVAESDGRSVLQDVVIQIGQARAMINGELSAAADLEGSRVSFEITAPDSSIIRDFLHLETADALPGRFDFSG